mmetsp:Transcript_4768/g.14071  ORF Transcript_4768/g.14071 Transcript_4768/m.14071 type:complete len:368 (-) Transcript_4768:1929-3032(-)
MLAGTDSSSLWDTSSCSSCSSSVIAVGSAPVSLLSLSCRYLSCFRSLIVPGSDASLLPSSERRSRSSSLPISSGRSERSLLDSDRSCRSLSWRTEAGSSGILARHAYSSVRAQRPPTLPGSCLRAHPTKLRVARRPRSSTELGRKASPGFPSTHRQASARRSPTRSGKATSSLDAKESSRSASRSHTESGTNLRPQPSARSTTSCANSPTASGSSASLRPLTSSSTRFWRSKTPPMLNGRTSLAASPQPSGRNLAPTMDPVSSRIATSCACACTCPRTQTAAQSARRTPTRRTSSCLSAQPSSRSCSRRMYVRESTLGTMRASRGRSMVIMRPVDSSFTSHVTPSGWMYTSRPRWSRMPGTDFEMRT